MNKKAGFFNNLLIILMLGALVAAGYYLYINFPREAIQLITQRTPDIQVNNTLPSKQFYDNMRYSDRIITYHISESCPESKSDRMKEALDTIEAKTIISFISTEKENAQIKILCSDISPDADEANHFVAGEGGPSKVLNSTLYSVIIEGKVALYREGSCDNSNVEIHEVLHALGFDHNNNPKSILYPTLKCDQQIDQEIIDSINELYETESLPDLVFDEVSANKSGRYLNFHIEVLNRGLKEAKSVEVGIYAGNTLVDSFDLKDITIGAKKIIDVQNLKVPFNAEKIDFVIDHESEIPEISEDNNKVVLTIS